MKKIMGAVLLSAALLFSIVACSSPSGGGTNTEQGSGSGTGSGSETGTTGKKYKFTYNGKVIYSTDEADDFEGWLALIEDDEYGKRNGNSFELTEEGYNEIKDYDEIKEYLEKEAGGETGGTTGGESSGTGSGTGTGTGSGSGTGTGAGTGSGTGSGTGTGTGSGSGTGTGTDANTGIDASKNYDIEGLDVSVNGGVLLDLIKILNITSSDYSISGTTLNAAESGMEKMMNGKVIVSISGNSQSLTGVDVIFFCGEYGLTSVDYTVNGNTITLNDLGLEKVMSSAGNIPGAGGQITPPTGGNGTGTGAGTGTDANTGIEASKNYDIAGLNVSVNGSVLLDLIKMLNITSSDYSISGTTLNAAASGMDKMSEMVSISMMGTSTPMPGFAVLAGFGPAGITSADYTVNGNTFVLNETGLAKFMSNNPGAGGQITPGYPGIGGEITPDYPGMEMYKIMYNGVLTDEMPEMVFNKIKLLIGLTEGVDYSVNETTKIVTLTDAGNVKLRTYADAVAGGEITPGFPGAGGQITPDYPGIGGEITPGPNFPGIGGEIDEYMILYNGTALFPVPMTAEDVEEMIADLQLESSDYIRDETSKTILLNSSGYAKLDAFMNSQPSM